MNPDYQPLILIGAGRSGTKLLRDLIAEHPCIDRVPYDVNYIWRLGNEDIPHDELKPETLTIDKKNRIIRQLTSYHAGAPYLIEKTVSNCLRVPFVNAVFPNARFLHLVRNGYDVVESVYRQWHAPPDWHYILRKARSFPITEAAGYAANYALSVLRRTFTNHHNSVTVWGPRYANVETDLSRFDLLIVCAIQWARCVDRALEGLAAIPAERILTIRYEQFVTQPLLHLEHVAVFLGLDSDPYETIVNRKYISEDNVGKGRRRLTKEQICQIAPHLEKGLTKLNYA